MAVNKIIYNGETLVDLTSDTVTADDLAAGVTATGADGKPLVGLLPKVTIDTELSTTSTNPVQNKTITAALSNLDIDIATNDEIDNALNIAGSGDLPTTGGIVPIAMGGTGATTTAGARTNLGVSATADFANVAFSGADDDLTGKPTIPSRTSDLANNSGYITSSALSGYVKSVNGAAPDSSGNVTISVSGGSSGGGSYTLPTASSSTLGGVKIGSGLTINTNGVVSADVTASTLTAYAKATDLSAVAKSGSYNDLSNKPAIPAAYTLPNATSSTLGGVKIGSNISVSSGVISLTRANVTGALGYTPPVSDTTYGNATTTSSGLMSSSDKSKLDSIAANANNYVHPASHPASMITGLTAVATSGSYNDLSDIPAIPVVDDSLSGDSTNAVQNKVVYGLGQKFFNQLSALASVARTGSYSDLTGTPGNATASAAGLMSAADKAKLDKIDADAGSVKLITYS